MDTNLVTPELAMSSLIGSFLVARPVLKDPNFSQTVVLILQHSEEGAFGLVVNRRAETDKVPFPLFWGGPCTSEGFMMIHGEKPWFENSGLPDSAEIAEGIFVGNPKTFELIEEDPDREGVSFRIFVGYAGWGPDQLEGELVQGAWATTKATVKLLFDTPPEQLWENIVPPSFPQPSSN